MPDDVNEALERFRSFLAQYDMDAVIDKASGFTANDGQLLAGEVEMLAQERRKEEQYPHDEA